MHPLLIIIFPRKWLISGGSIQRKFPVIKNLLRRHKRSGNMEDLQHAVVSITSFILMNIRKAHTPDLDLDLYCKLSLCSLI